MALSFDGTDDYVESSTLPIPSATYPFTLFSMFKVVNTTASHTLLALDSASSGRRVMLQADGATAGDPVIAYAFDSAGNQANSASGFLANTWHAGIAIFTAANSRTAGIDAVLGSAQTTNRSASWNRLRIGARQSSGIGSFCNGLLAEQAIWNVALTAEDFVALSKGIPPSRVRASSLVFYAPMVRHLYDARGGIALTVNGGGLTVADHSRRIL